MARTTPTTTPRYFEAVGRRKTAIARVRITPDSATSYSVNGRTLESYFPIRELTQTVGSALDAANAGTFAVSARLKGGGQSAQAEALRHGIARALLVYDATLRRVLKGPGFLKRDPRAKERKKFGLKKARKAAQWSKR